MRSQTKFTCPCGKKVVTLSAKRCKTCKKHICTECQSNQAGQCVNHIVISDDFHKFMGEMIPTN